jgi:hypothetical protein
MARPTTREAFKEYCLRSLGAPTIDINVDDEQLEDRIDDALQYYRDYHFDGTEETYLPHIKNKGACICFPSYTYHRVTPVTSGIRKSLVVWFRGPKWI